MKNLEKILASVGMMVVICLIPVVSQATKQDMRINGVDYSFDMVDVYVNGERLVSDAPAAIVNNRTFIPLRAVSESLGCKVTWSDQNKEAHIYSGAIAVNIIPGNTAMLRQLYTDDGIIKQEIRIDTQAFIEENTGRIYIPLRAVSEAMFCDVEWDGSRQRADVQREFDYIYQFDSNGLAKVKVDVCGKCGVGFIYTGGIDIDKYGIIDSDGNMVVPIIYDWIYSFQEGFAVVKKKGKEGAVNKDGEVVIPTKYDYLGFFSEGLALVQEDEQYGFINTDGKTVISCIYDSASGFDDGLAWVEIDEKYGYIDKKGNEVIPIKYDDLECFSEGLARAKKNDKYGFVNKQGQTVIPFEYDRARSFSEGLAIVEKNGEYGFIDRNNEVVIPFEYDHADEFEDGVAVVEKNDMKGCIDAKNNIIIPFEYDWIEVVENNYFLVTKKGKSGVINNNNDVVIPIKYDRIHIFYGEKREYYFVVDDGYYEGVMDTNGNLLLPIEYDNVLNVTDAYAQVEKDGEYFYIDF